MSRRRLTLTLGGVLLALLAGVVGFAAVPYVTLEPGPTYNTLGREGGRDIITITGRPTFPDTGHLNLTTIRVNPRLTFVQALAGWFDRQVAVVPREVIYPPDKTVQQVQQEDRAAIAQSENSATTAALRQLGVPGRTTVVVEEVQQGSPSTGLLQAGDVLVSVDGTAVRDAAELRRLIGRRLPGRPVRIGYRRGAATAQVSVRTGVAREPDGSFRPVIGVLTGERTEFPVKVDISLQQVGGPSAGLMFALGIVDKLTPGSLTGGRFIAGTGTIDDRGNVGPIGGIQQKLIGARSKGAQVFLVPAGNCAAALQGPPDGLRLVKVTSLPDALGQLGRLAAGQPTTPCS